MTPRAWAVAILAALTAAASDADEGVPGPPVPGWKATLSLYQVPGDQSGDANLRYKTNAYALWVGAYRDFGARETQIRLGAEYDYQEGPALVIPSLQVATHGLVAGSLYSELGRRWFGVLGFSRTDLRPFFNLTFDPNESLQIGAGRAFGDHDRVTGYSILDVRLGTGQQNAHLVWRHRARSRRLTLDGLLKSGHADDGRYVRALGATATYDFPRWFVRFAYDPYANFSTVRMLRFTTGLRF